MDMTILLPILLLQGVFFIYCVNIIVKNSVKYLPKLIWTILCVNTLGCIIFLLVGKGEIND